MSSRTLLWLVPCLIVWAVLPFIVPRNIADLLVFTGIYTVAGLGIGLLEAIAGGYVGGEYKLLTTFSTLIVVLMIRPYGLFGTHEIERL